MLFQRQKRNSMVYQSHFIPLCLQGGVQKKKEEEAVLPLSSKDFRKAIFVKSSGYSGHAATKFSL